LTSTLLTREQIDDMRGRVDDASSAVGQLEGWMQEQGWDVADPLYQDVRAAAEAAFKLYARLIVMRVQHA
jgi:hypothetical protein